MGNTLKDKTAKGLMWGAVNNGATQVLNALFGIILARKLSESDYGLIGMLMIFSLIATSLQDSGFVTALTNRKNATHEDYNSVFWFNVSVSLCIYVIFYFCSPLIASFYDEPLLTSLSRYYFFGFFIASFSIVPRAILFRKLKQKELAMMGLSSLIISGVTGVTLVFQGMAYWGLATQTLTFNLCVSLFSWYLSGWRPSTRVTMKPIREMFSFSSKMLLTNIANQINNNIFSVILGKLYNKSEVGFYNQANKWNLMGSNTITGMIQGVAQPVFVQVGDDKERLRRTFRKMLRFTCFICFPAMFGLSLVAPEFITILIKDKWLPSAYLMRMLCVGGAFLPIAALYYNLIISRGKSDVYMWNIISQGITILLAITTSYYLIGEVDIHIFGTHTHLTAIKVMILSYVTIIISWTAIWHHFLKREIGLSYLDAAKDITPFLVIAAMSVIVTYLVTSTVTNIYLLLPLRVALTVMVYLVVLWNLKANILRECLDYLIKRKKK